MLVRRLFAPGHAYSAPLARRSASQLALTADEFSRRMVIAEQVWSGTQRDSPRRLAVAVSGGPDSLALAALVRDWCIGRSVNLTLLCVDHGLRAESAEEAEVVASLARRWGVAHCVLRLDWGDSGLPRAAQLQTDARERRYAALERYCQTHGIPCVSRATLSTLQGFVAGPPSERPSRDIFAPVRPRVLSETPGSVVPLD